MFRVKGSGRQAFEVNGSLQDVRSDFSERGGGGAGKPGIYSDHKGL